MEKINIDDYLFHGIQVYGLYKNQKEEQVKTFQNIVKIGYIASRKYLKEILSPDEFNDLNLGNPNWNGENYVSITPSLSKQDRYPGHLGGKKKDLGGSAYDIFVMRKLAIILNSKLLKELPIRKGKKFNNMLGEIQVEDKIPSEYFVGISIPYVADFDRCFNACVRRICDKDDHYPPDYWEKWYDSYYKEIKREMIECSSEQMVEKWYKSVILFEGALKSFSSPLRLYEEGTGRQIVPSEEKRCQIEKLKEKVLTFL